MLTIGTFARFAGVSVRALHHYEQVGLLAPSQINPQTGYRRYEPHQLPRLHRIVALKELGLSLAQVRLLLDDLSAEQLSGMLRLKRAELASELEDQQRKLAMVEQQLKHIEMENDVIDIVVKDIPALRVAQIRWTGAEGTDFDEVADFVRPAVAELASQLELDGVITRGAAFVHYEVDAQDKLIPAVAIEINDQPLVPSNRVTIETLGPTAVASTIFHGQPHHDAIAPLYGKLVQFAGANGYAPRGPGRDVLVGESPDGFVIELQLPIEKI